MMLSEGTTEALAQLTEELKNFQQIAGGSRARPGSVPELAGIDVYGEIMPLNGVVGGDHMIYVDFKKRYDLDARIRVAAAAGRTDVVRNLERCRRMAGIAVIDVSGHQVTDAMIAAMLHQAFLLGSLYELDMFGHITQRLFENLTTRFHRTSQVNKFVTAIYGEISEDATFRFLSAAHPPPIVFSAAEDRFMEVSPDLCTSFPPLGTLPSEDVIDRARQHSVLGFKNRYELNEWKLMGAGDILMLHTDGLVEHSRGNERYYPARLEQTVRRVKRLGAAEIVGAIRDDLHAFAPPADDVTIVVIKRE
jgi:serine phosphatase RsbU (regulator of sigma subunit)